MSRLAAKPASSQQLMKGERGMFMTSDDNSLIKQITGTHAPDGREIDAKSVLVIAEDIFRSATRSISDGPSKDVVEEVSHQANFAAMLEPLTYIINRLSCEISYKCVGGVDGHSMAISLFNMLSSYTWAAKLALTIAAFALNYGEFWLLAQIYQTNWLAKNMAILKQLPEMLEQSALLKPRFDALQSLIKSILDLTKCIIQLTELPSNYISPDIPALSTALASIPIAAYWIIRSVISSATYITYLSGMSHEFTVSTTEVWELSSLSHKISNINDHLQRQLSICYQHIDEKKRGEAYDALLHTFETVHIDNMKTLKSIIYAKDDVLPLLEGTTKRRVSLDVLRRKTVLLLISGIDISQDELAILEQIYSESRIHSTRVENQYQLIWLPIVDSSAQWTDASQKRFESLQATMTWYSVYHPSLIDQVVIRFIKEKWQFKNKPILVVLDPQGRVVSPNAFHMMWIWGSNAFPFTSNREEALWREESWRLELLIDGIDPVILNWIMDGKHIILYGGDDIEWIRKFTAAARVAAKSARIPLEMVYVGKSSKREQVRRIMATIQVEKISNVWFDIVMIWFFWTRLEAMLYSKIQLGSVDEGDPVLQEIKKLLSYDKSGVWAVYSKGSQVEITGFGTTVLAALQEFDQWKDDVETKGFGIAFKEYYEKLHDTDHPCCRFEFPTTVGRTPETMKCPECRRSMEKYVTFSCCHDTPI